MCEPTTIALASLAIGVASAGASFVQQGQQAKAADRSARENYTQQSQAIKLQYDQPISKPPMKCP